MRTLHMYNVRPAIPERLACLEELALNLRWSWDHETHDLFQRLDADLWRQTKHNPVLLLLSIDQERLLRASEDDAFLANLDRVCSGFHAYMSERGWFPKAFPEAAGMRIGYFSMEFGLAESLPIYSGGLGVLAGDHLKTASQLDLPLVGVGLLYQKGYFTQYLTNDGWQLERYPINDFGKLPIRPVLGDEGAPLIVTVDLAGKPVAIQVWLAQVGRIPLYLLDTNTPPNEPSERDITDELYGGGPEERIRQEIVLGIGGIRALRAMGIEPEVCHMNEGHSAFLSLERIRQLMKDEGLDYWVARQATGAGTVFTTHTPVPAGFDLFPSELMQKYFGEYSKELGLDWQQFMGKGRLHADDPNEPFNVAALAVRHAPRRNAVSRLHRSVTAHMLKETWTELPEDDIPVGWVTNGVHLSTWTGPDMAVLLDRYVGPRWREDPSDHSLWSRVHRIPDEELWRAHVRSRESLVAFARIQLESQLERRHASAREVEVARSALRSDALTIGFARRFATYKRATLLLREVDRLKALLLDEERPVQFLFGGKAHPRDDAGKEFIRQIVRFAQTEGVSHRFVFLEDYDISKARAMVAGVDVWLNTPRRPMEASGTSGMKTLPNGGLNLSVIDGWWAEGYRDGAGWAIGGGEQYDDFEYQDRIEAQALFSLLEQDVVPLFYERGPDGLPHGWIKMMKRSMSVLSPLFSSTRMVKEYAESYYLPAYSQSLRLSADGFTAAKQIAEWKNRVTEAWHDVNVVSVSNSGPSDVVVGESLPLEARVHLGSLTPADVRVEIYHGVLSPDGSITHGRSEPMEWVAVDGDLQLYRGAIPSELSGAHAFAVRILPSHEDVLTPNEMTQVSWE